MDQAKILNPKTNRYVKIDGKIGKLLLQERQERQEINSAPSVKASSIKNVSAINVSVKNVNAVKAVKAVKTSIQNSMQPSSIKTH